jgi:hypothetical protein
LASVRALSLQANAWHKLRPAASHPFAHLVFIRYKIQFNAMLKESFEACKRPGEPLSRLNNVLELNQPRSGFGLNEL